MADEQTKEKASLKDYSGDEKYNRKSALLTALLKWLECEFFGLFIFLWLLAMTLVLGDAGDFLFGLVGLICNICVLADFGLKEGSRAHVKIVVRGDDVSKNYGLLLGLISSAPSILSYILLLLSYFGVIGSAVLPFKILNCGLWGLINLFVSDMKISNMSPYLLAVFPIIILLYILSVFIAFRLGHKNEDIVTKIVYKKQ
ncbi:MAG: hypothetical protein LUI06_05855 [Ruminococcus sp.]|nr:hypothetical protein [Ruminococcus sp.]